MNSSALKYIVNVLVLIRKWKSLVQRGDLMQMFLNMLHQDLIYHWGLIRIVVFYFNYLIQAMKIIINCEVRKCKKNSQFVIRILFIDLLEHIDLQTSCFLVLLHILDNFQSNMNSSPKKNNHNEMIK